MPTPGVAPAELAEHRRFFAEMERLRALRGATAGACSCSRPVLSSNDTRIRGARPHHASRPGWSRRLPLAHPALVPELLLPRRLRHALRPGLGLGRPALFLQAAGARRRMPAIGAWLTWPGGLEPVAEAHGGALGHRAPGRHRGVAQAHERWRRGAVLHARTTARRTTYLVQGAQGDLRDAAVRGRARGRRHRRAIGFDREACTLPELCAVDGGELPDEGFSARAAGGAAVLGQCGVSRNRAWAMWSRPTRTSGSSRPEKTVFTAYVALSRAHARRGAQLDEKATPQELIELASADLKAAYGWKFAPCVERVDITLRGARHGGAPPGFSQQCGLARLARCRRPDPVRACRFVRLLGVRGSGVVGLARRRTRLRFLSRARADPHRSAVRRTGRVRGRRCRPRFLVEPHRFEHEGRQLQARFQCFRHHDRRAGALEQARMAFVARAHEQRHLGEFAPDAAHRLQRRGGLSMVSTIAGAWSACTRRSSSGREALPKKTGMPSACSFETSAALFSKATNGMSWAVSSLASCWPTRPKPAMMIWPRACSERVLVVLRRRVRVRRVRCRSPIARPRRASSGVMNIDRPTASITRAPRRRVEQLGLDGVAEHDEGEFAALRQQQAAFERAAPGQAAGAQQQRDDQRP